MSLFQCQNCGCCENTALSHQGFAMMAECFDWTGKEELRGKKLCSACGPTHYSDGTKSSRSGRWHGAFARVFLPMGMFKTNRSGNLEHIESGSENYRDYVLEGVATCDAMVPAE
jgi:hypothetical protein